MLVVLILVGSRHAGEPGIKATKPQEHRYESDEHGRSEHLQRELLRLREPAHIATLVLPEASGWRWPGPAVMRAGGLWLSAET